ncbi:hypothetical protein [Reyranella sp.]|uniref:hypothetical protein n=1 Tax=Reyranella sp. TaxID=1929291 RepID=UPI003BAC0D32
MRATAALPVALAGTVVAAGAALLATAGLVVSREMSWDLLFNLAGAWHLANGQVANVDFHDPVGQLYFRLTQLGMWICGPTVAAFVAGNILAAVALFAAAAVAAATRLPPVAAALFMLFPPLLVLMPANIGDDPTHFTFAMSYNDYGWATISILCLLLFLPRRRPTAPGDWVDALVGGLLMAALYHLKITYFAAALGALGVAYLVEPHVRRPAWLVAGGLVLANAVAPWNWPYLADLAEVAARPGAVADYLVVGHLEDLLRTSGRDQALCLLLLAMALGLFWLGRASWRLPLAVAALVVLAGALLVFNTQARGLPLVLVAAFLLHACLRDDPVMRPLAAAPLVLPLASVLVAASSLLAYREAAARPGDLLVVDRTNLRGLAVPAGDVPIRNGEEIDQDDYVGTILEAASLLRRTANGGQGVVVFDQVNPMPFVLGRAPRRGARLWLDVNFPWPAPATMFAGVRHVLVPRQPTYAAVTSKALDLYGDYLAEHFPKRTESPHWILFSRAP